MDLRPCTTAIELPIADWANHLLSRGDESYFCVRGRIRAAYFSSNKIRRNFIEKNSHIIRCSSRRFPFVVATSEVARNPRTQTHRVRIYLLERG